MFKKDSKVEEGDSVETIIGPSVRVEGTFSSHGNIIVEGQVAGSLQTIKNLRVGEQAVIQANVEAQNAIIAGTVEGNLTIADALEVTASARIFGDISTAHFSLEQGAFFSGRCNMQTPSDPAKKQDAKPPEAPTEVNN